jgi:hypothetical protein
MGGQSETPKPAKKFPMVIAPSASSIFLRKSPLMRQLASVPLIANLSFPQAFLIKPLNAFPSPILL